MIQVDPIETHGVMLDTSLQTSSSGEVAYAAVIGALVSISDLIGNFNEIFANGSNLPEKLFKRHVSIRQELSSLIKEWEPIIENQRSSGEYPLYAEFERDLPSLTFEKSDMGAGGCYFAKKDGEALYVVKPVDEDINGYNNHWGLHASDRFLPVELDEGLELGTYRAFARDQLISDFATSLGIGESAPETVVGIVESDQFFDRIDFLGKHDRDRLEEAGVGKMTRKLCTIQKFIEGSKPLMQLVHENLEPMPYHKSFEEVCALMVLGRETDGHFGNILAVDSINKGEREVRLIKIDSSFTFPGNHNENVYCGLFYHDFANRKFSDDLYKSILSFDLDKFTDRMKRLKFTKAEINAFIARFTMFGYLLENRRTIKEVAQAMNQCPEEVKNDKEVTDNDRPDSSWTDWLWSIWGGTGHETGQYK